MAIEVIKKSRKGFLLGRLKKYQPKERFGNSCFLSFDGQWLYTAHYIPPVKNHGVTNVAVWAKGKTRSEAKHRAKKRLLKPCLYT